MENNENTQNDKYIRMTTAPVQTLILRLAVPTMISMLVTSFYNLVDTIFVGHLNDVNATAALAVALSLMNIIQAIGFYFGQGSGSFISRALGKKNYEECRKMAATGFFGAVAVGILILVLGLIFIKPIVTLLGSKGEEQARIYATQYISIILFGAPVMCGSFVINNQLRFQGNALFAMVGLASGAVVNIFLDALLVPHFKVVGAAAATVICQYLSFAILLVCAFVFSDNVKFSIKDFSFRFYYAKEIFRGGFPSLCRQGIASVMNISLMNCCNATAAGEITAEVLQAAFGIVSRIMMFLSSMLIGFGQGFQPVCGFNYGAGKFDRVRKGYRFCVIAAFLFLLTVSAVFFCFAPDLVALVQLSDQNANGAATVRIAAEIMRFQLPVLPLMSFVVMSNMMMQVTGNVVGASVLAMARQGLFLIPVMFIFSHFFGVRGLECAQAVADVLSVLVTIPFVIIVLSKMKRLERRSVAAGGNADGAEALSAVDNG